MITTERLILRPFQPENEKDLLDFFEYRKGEEIPAYQGSKKINTIEEAKELIFDEYITIKGEKIVFAAEHKELECIIGMASLTLNNENDEVIVGYEFGVDYWGFGYATETLKALIDYSFNVLQANRIEGRHFDNNEASGRVMEKCGMKLEGISRQKVKMGSLYRDIYKYAILKVDFDV